MNHEVQPLNGKKEQGKSFNPSNLFIPIPYPPRRIEIPAKEL
jgi:hypothetical protein